MTQPTNPPFPPALSYPVSRSYCIEQAFYEAYSTRLPPDVQVPKLLYTSLRPGELYVMTDLNLLGLSIRKTRAADASDRDEDRGVDGEYLSDADLHACLAWMAKFHATFLAMSGAAPAPAADAQAVDTATVLTAAEGTTTTTTTTAAASKQQALWPSGCYWHLRTRQEEHARMQEGDPLKALASSFDMCVNVNRACVHAYKFVCGWVCRSVFDVFFWCSPPHPHSTSLAQSHAK